MKSRISIEIDFDNNNTPIIQILHSDSDDVRDKLISNFAEMLGGSSWCQIKWLNNSNIESRALGIPDRIYITPIHPSKFKEQADIMLEQARINEGSSAAPREYVSRFNIGDSADYTTDQWVNESFEKAKRDQPEIKEEDIVHTPYYSYGKVVAIKFTEAKVWYDMLDDFTGKVVENIVSQNVRKLASEFSISTKNNGQ